MAPQTPKTAFKSYEVQARLLRAIVAAHPEVKWNYKEIALHYGQDASIHSIGHRFRHLRTQAEIIRLGLNANLDPQYLFLADKNLPKDQNGIDRKNIAKYFGESTTDGIQFQFRAIKKDAAAMRTAIVNNESPIKAVSSSISTPTSNRRKSAPAPKTPSALKSPAIAHTGASSALGNMTVKREFLDDTDWDKEPDPDATPTRPPQKKKRHISTGPATKLPAVLSPEKHAPPPPAFSPAAPANTYQYASLSAVPALPPLSSATYHVGPAAAEHTRSAAPAVPEKPVDIDLTESDEDSSAAGPRYPSPFKEEQMDTPVYRAPADGAKASATATAAAAAPSLPLLLPRSSYGDGAFDLEDEFGDVDRGVIDLRHRSSYGGRMSYGGFEDDDGAI